MKTIVKNNLSEKYSRGTILIHWLSFLLIILLIPLGFIMSDMEPSLTKLNLLKLHLVIGLLVFILTLIRVWFFFRSKRPAKLQTGNNLHNRLVIWLESLFYYVLIMLCISGFATIMLSTLGGALQRSDILLLTEDLDVPPLKAHNTLAIILIILMIGHIGGVINHYVKTKENILKRILP